MVRNIGSICGLFIVWSLLGSCNSLTGPDPSSDPASSFDALWKGFDQYYGGFEERHVNWDSLYRVYRPYVNSQTTDDSLYSVMLSLLRELKDSHVSLESPFRFAQSDTATYDSTSGYIFGAGLLSVVAGTYHFTPDYKFLYGKTADSIGYIRIKDFWVHIKAYRDQNDTWCDQIDDILNKFKGCKRLIIDVRNNEGGDVEPLLQIAGRFMATQHDAIVVRARNGPGHADFTEPYINSIGPAGPEQFTGKIVVLANRNSVSAAEWFVLIARTCWNATVIGTPTRGALSARSSRELPNGWTYTIPGQRVTTISGERYEGRGIPPDITVEMSIATGVANRDPVIDRALQELR
jgi:hypothetical protein